MLETKIPKIDLEALGEATRRLGFAAMSAALIFSLLELSDEAKRAIMPSQPVFVNAGENDTNNPARREREETAPHFISYSEVQRTPSRSGRG